MKASVGFSGSYAAEDVTFLLEPLAFETVSLTEKEHLLRSGARHYSEILSDELPPSPAYLAAYDTALMANAVRLAGDIKALAAALAERSFGPRGLALASLARAGTPIGVLLLRELRRRGIVAEHYSISIVRDRGIDRTAIEHILARHDAADIVFVDGWTGKGAIAGELRNSSDLAALDVAPFLAVVADPAGQADLAATAEDYVIPSGILNGIVSGLVSRSVLSGDIAPGRFHGCKLLTELAPHDRSRSFIARIEAEMLRLPAAEPARRTDQDRTARRAACQTLVAALMEEFGLASRNAVKPGIAEATRAVLRRNPRVVLVEQGADAVVDHLLQLCAEREVRIERRTQLGGYRAVALLA
jgi:hypothetical protein